MRRGISGTHGLTLIELVTAMAIFALVAVFGLQGLAGMIRMRDGLEDHSARATELDMAISVLRADIGAAVPLRFHPPDGSAPREAMHGSVDGDALHLSIGGQKTLDLARLPGLHRAEYRLDRASGTLTRRIWSTLTPADASALSPEVPLLGGVSAIYLRSHWPGTGWQDGFAADAGGDRAHSAAIGHAVRYASPLPQAVEVTLEIRGMGTVTVIESLR